jgi:hypothetical protein
MVKAGDYVQTSGGYVGFVQSVSSMQTGGFSSFATGYRMVATVAIGSKNGRIQGVSEFVERLTVLPNPAK